MSFVFSLMVQETLQSVSNNPSGSQYLPSYGRDDSNGHTNVPDKYDMIELVFEFLLQTNDVNHTLLLHLMELGDGLMSNPFYTSSSHLDT